MVSHCSVLLVHCELNSVLGLRESDIMDCVTWMRPFAHVLDQQQRVELKKFSQVAVDNAHNIQTHVVSLELLVCCYCQSLQNAYCLFTVTVILEKSDIIFAMSGKFFNVCKYRCLCMACRH